jgi:hypothetical protein
MDTSNSYCVCRKRLTDRFHVYSFDVYRNCLDDLVDVNMLNSDLETACEWFENVEIVRISFEMLRRKHYTDKSYFTEKNN